MPMCSLACFVGGTGMSGVTVRLFFPAGVIGDLRFVLIFCFSPGGSGVSFCPAALSLLRGFGAVWSFVLEARAFRWSLCVSLRHLAPLTVSSPSPLGFFRPGLGVCRRPGRGKNTGLAQLASHGDLRGQDGAGFSRLLRRLHVCC